MADSAVRFVDTSGAGSSELDLWPAVIITKEEIEAEGFKVALNEPYSGRNGLMYSAMRHGRAHGALYLELELNQKLIGTAGDARKMGSALTRAFRRLRFRSR